jgi:hypothetical protein
MGKSVSKDYLQGACKRIKEALENKGVLKNNIKGTINKDILSNQNLLKYKQSLKIQTPKSLR